MSEFHIYTPTKPDELTAEKMIEYSKSITGDGKLTIIIDGGALRIGNVLITGKATILVDSWIEV